MIFLRGHFYIDTDQQFRCLFLFFFFVFLFTQNGFSLIGKQEHYNQSSNQNGLNFFAVDFFFTQAMSYKCSVQFALFFQSQQQLPQPITQVIVSSRFYQLVSQTRKLKIGCSMFFVKETDEVLISQFFLIKDNIGKMIVYIGIKKLKRVPFCVLAKVQKYR